MISKQDLIEFEQECAAAFNAGKIRAPLHLSAGNEDQLIEIFQRVKPTDWVFSTWRSHFHALLHGVPREQLMAKVLAGESISINVPERRFYSSAICGGCLPIALGVAWSIKRENAGLVDVFAPVYGNSDPHVWCFVGDMAAEMGAFSECRKYASYHDLPVTFIIENNGKCVNADTRELWGRERNHVTECNKPNCQEYCYQLGWPHMGTGKFIEFADKQEFSPTGGM